MTDPQKILCTIACMELLRNQQDHLYNAVGGIYRLYESMPEGEHKNQLLDKISALDVIANGLWETLDILLEDKG